MAALHGSLTYHYLYDANGNVGQVVDSSDGSLAAHYEYDPYGNLVSSDGVFAQQNPYRFSTKYFDPEASLYYYGYRYYSAEFGRWVNRDPLEERGGLNIYSPFINNPINNSDSLGLKTVKTACKATTLKAKILAEVVTWIRNIDIVNLYVSDDTTYLQDLYGKENWKVIGGGTPVRIDSIPEIKVPTNSIRIKDIRLKMDVVGDDVGKVIGIELKQAWEIKISGNVFASGESILGDTGSCAFINYEANGSLEFSRRDPKTKSIKRAKGVSPEVKGTLGDCSGKSYCCSFDFSQHISLAGLSLVDLGALGGGQQLGGAVGLDMEIDIFR